MSVYTFTDAGGIIWNYTLDASNNASIGTGIFANGGNATTSGTALSGAKIIPSTITNGSQNYPVTGIGQVAFRYCWSLTAVTIPSSVTSIGSYAFGSCGVTSAIIPNLVTSIVDGTFGNNTSVTSVTFIGNSVTSIGNYAFNGCNNLTFINIPDSVKSIGTYGFAYGTKLTSIRIPDSVTSIAADAFINNNTALVVTIRQSRAQAFGFVGNLPLYNQTFFGGTSVDLALPTLTMTITATAGGSPIASGSITKNTPIVLTFTSSASTTDFLGGNIGVIDATNGNLSNFAGSGTVYTATFTPNGQGPVVCTINVLANKFTADGLNNNASNTFTFIFDAAPSMAITSTIANNAISNIASIPLTFTASESITGFIKQDISFNKGTLGDLSGSGSVYTATFTQGGQGAHTIYVPVGAYADTSGNANTAVASFNWTYDSISPTMDISSTTLGVTRGSTTKTTPIDLIFTSSEATTNFQEVDISFNNGTLSNFAAISDTVYTARFTPTSPGPVACTIDVLAGAYTDAATNLNNLATQFAFTFDSVPPTMAITSSAGTSGSIIDNATIPLTFTSSKATNNFVVGDISVTNGTLSSPLGGSGSVYTATFTPTRQGLCTINVASGTYTDAAGNNNAAANTFSFSYIPKFAAFNNANNLEQTYIAGFLDVSGNINHRSRDLTAMDGNLIVSSGNVSLNSGNLYMGSNVSINSGLMVTGPTTLQQMAASTNIDVSGATTLVGAVSVAGLTTFNNNVGIANNKNFTVGSGTTVLGGDVSMNSALKVAGDVSMNSTLSVTGLTTLANTSIAGTLVVNGKSTFTTDMSFVAVDVDICGNLRAQYLANSIPLSAIIGGGSLTATDVSMNAGLSVAGATTASTLTAKGNTAIGGALAVTGAATLAALTATGAVTLGNTLRVTEKTVFATDASFNGSRVDIYGNLYANYPDNSIPASAIISNSNSNTDISMNAKLSVAGKTALASTLVVTGKTTFLNDVSFGVSGSRVDICGNLYANYAGNSIAKSAIIGGIGGSNAIFNTDVNMNAGLYVQNSIKVDTAKLEYISSALNVNTVLIPTSLTTSTLTIGSTLNVSGSTALATLTSGSANVGGTLFVTGATTTATLTAGNTNVGGTLYLTAATTFPSDVSINSTLTVASDVSINSPLFVGNDASCGSTLFVNRAVSLNSTLFVNGATTLAGVYASTLSVTGATTMTDTAYVTGNSTMGGLLALALPYTFPADASLNSKLTVGRDVSLNATLNVTGATSVAELTIPNNMTLNSTLNVSLATTITTDVSANARLLVINAATLNSTMSVATTTDLAGTMQVTGATTASTITASGITTIGGTLTVNGKTSISGNVTFNSNTVDVSGNLRAGSLGFPSGSAVVRYNQFGDWVKIGNDIDGEAALDESGWSTALSADGSIIAVGAYKNDGTTTSTGDRGHVKVYQRDATNTTIAPIGWKQLGSDIDGEAASDQSGYSLSLSADGFTVAIGANLNDGTVVSGTDNRGHVRVYQYISQIWTKLGNDIDGEIAADRSGISVSLSADGTIVAIGANNNDGTTGTPTDIRGHVRIYEYVSSNWTQLGGDIDGEAAGDGSGISVSLVRDPALNVFVAIGASNNDGTTTNSTDIRGHVRVYQYDVNKTADALGPAKWKRLGGDIDGEAANDGSGVSVALAANWPNVFVAIGANNNDGTTTNSTDNRGHVRVYQYAPGKAADTNQGSENFGPTEWKRLGADIDGETAADESGWSVALSSDGSIVAIGGYKNDGTSGGDNGHVRVYKYQSGIKAWSQFGSDIDGEAGSDLFGDSVSLSADGLTLAVGANQNDGTTTNTSDNRGHVRVFKFSLPSGLYTNAPLIMPNAITTGDVALYDACNVARATSLTGTLSVAGATTVSTLNTSSNASVGGALTVAGATTSGGTLNVSGATTSTTMSLSSNAVIGGTLIVSGAATMQTLNLTGPIKKC